jgi:hypothetical protein
MRLRFMLMTFLLTLLLMTVITPVSAISGGAITSFTVYCDRFVVTHNALTFNRNNTGTGNESYQLTIVDGYGMGIFYYADSRPVGSTIPALTETFYYDSAPNANPIRLVLVSDMGVLGGPQFVWDVEGNCPNMPIPDINLISNGTFSNGLNDWIFSNSTQSVVGGALQIAPNTVGGGGFFQFVNFNSITDIFDVDMRLANNSGDSKTFNLIVRDSDWNPQYNCVFVLPAYAPYQNYRMRFNTYPNYIQPMILQGWISGSTSQGLLVDNITMNRRVGLSVPSTQCTVAPLPFTNLISNGDFNLGMTNWAAFNAAMQVVNIGGTNGNVLELARWNATPNGGFYQYLPYSAPANGVFQLNFQIGNQSNTARVINMLVRNPDWSDTHSCFITVPANTPLTNVQIKLKTGVNAWSNIVFQGWIQVGNYTGTPPLPFRFDNISLQYLPNGTSGTTECPAPIPMPQRPTMTPSETPTLTVTPTFTLTSTLTETSTPEITPTVTEAPTETATDIPTITPEPPTATLESPTSTPEPPTATPEPPTLTPTEIPSNTPEPPPEVTQNP